MEKIEVSVAKGSVTLEGTMASYWHKHEAETEALHATGTLSVTNKLAMVPMERIADEALARVIVNAIDRNIHVNVDDVDVAIRDGKGDLVRHSAQPRSQDSRLPRRAAHVWGHGYRG